MIFKAKVVNRVASLYNNDEHGKIIRIIFSCQKENCNNIFSVERFITMYTKNLASCIVEKDILFIRSLVGKKIVMPKTAKQLAENLNDVNKFPLQKYVLVKFENSFKNSQEITKVKKEIIKGIN